MAGTCGVCGRKYESFTQALKCSHEEDGVMESGWLIEKGQLCLGSCSNKPAWVTFTNPTAVRFARKVDAENMLASLRSMGHVGAFQNCTINDHAWGL